MIFLCLYALLSCMLCFHVFFAFVFAHMYAFLWYQKCKPSKHSKNRIPTQTFEKWHNISYRYVRYIKSETSGIWRTGAWFLKPFGEKVQGNHVYDLVNPNFTVKAKRVYRGCKVCYQVFLENGKIGFNSKIWNFNINFQT